MTYYLGIDPGASGGLAVVSEDGLVEAHHMPETEVDLLNLCRAIRVNYPHITAWLERVSSMPGQGVSSVFTFGTGYGAIRMALLSSGIGFMEVSPVTWMKMFSMKRAKEESKTSWKNRLKGRAQQLYPNEHITLSTADAVLIAHAHMLSRT